MFFPSYSNQRLCNASNYATSSSFCPYEINYSLIFLILQAVFYELLTEVLNIIQRT